MMKIEGSDPHPDPLVRCMDPRIRIHTKNVMDPQHWKNDVNVPSKSISKKNYIKKISFLLTS
jgi:hypothetical protein